MAKLDEERRALALSSGLGRTALVFEDNDVVDLLRIAIEREGGQSAFARHHGINRQSIKHDFDRQESCGRRDCGACRASQGVRHQMSALPVSVLQKYH
jgi:hypothetical protein